MNDKQQETKKTGDNLSVVDVLTDFNTQEAKEGSTEGDNVVAGNEATEPKEPKETKQQEDDRQETVNYLIDNKFKDDTEGKQQLAKAYKELQSKNDKQNAAHQTLQTKTKRLVALDKYLKSNPEVVKQLKTKITEDQKALTGPPKKPDGYDIMDEAIEGSDSAKWRDKQNDWLVNQGRNAANEEINKFKQEKAQETLLKQDTKELENLGLSADDMSNFRAFMQNSQNMNNANLVKIWRMLNGKQVEPVENKGQEVPQPKKNQQTSAAAVSGSVPVATSSASKELDSFWDGIMGTSNRVYSRTDKK